MIFNNEEARIGLWNFISAHFSMIDKVEGNTYTDEKLSFLLEDSSIKETISPYFMARIVDFVGFMKEYRFKKVIMKIELGNLCLQIQCLKKIKEHFVLI